MIRFFIYSSSDQMEYVNKIEEYLNNSKVEIVDIRHQKILHHTHSVQDVFVKGKRHNALTEEYIAYITYKERG